MSKFQTALLLGVLVAGPALAQTAGSTSTAATPTVPPMSVPSVTVPAPATTTPPASNSAPQALTVAPADAKTSAAPVPGANSFTEAQARSRVESRGFTNVTSLMKDEQSIWRGRATKDGREVAIAVDYQGNVVAQ